MPFELASAEKVLNPGLFPRLLAEAVADHEGGFVVLRLDNGEEEISLTLMWGDAEDAARDLLALAAEARAMEDDYREAQSRHDYEEEPDGSCLEQASGTCPLCS